MQIKSLALRKIPALIESYKGPLRQYCCSKKFGKKLCSSFEQLDVSQAFLSDYFFTNYI